FGAERVLLAAGRGLADRGHAVALDFPHDGPAVSMARELPGVAVGVTARHRLPRSALEGLGFLASAPRAVAAARRAVRAAAPDLVWVNSLYNPWAAIGARLSGAPVVWHLHEAPLREPLGSPVAALLGWAATRIVVVSEFVAGEYRQYPWLRDRIVVAPNPFLDRSGPLEGEALGESQPPEGAASDSAPPGGRAGDADATAFTVGYIGQLEPRKRAPDLVAAVARVADVRALIVGDGKARDAVEAMIRGADVGDRVRLVGFQADVAPWLRRFDCMAIPSLREPFGLVALEAMAAGVPVIAARSGALPDVLGDAALYHEPGRPAELARQIRRLEAEPALRDTLRRRGLDRVRAFRIGPWLDTLEATARDAVREHEAERSRQG
ncbi:MAG: glycosyltransferase family 4 protein, partial [Longimicrobiales bacterium]|nr:glycosyltransferase family 4 protein [Longimicrobiales bacterium]